MTGVPGLVRRLVVAPLVVVAEVVVLVLAALLALPAALLSPLTGSRPLRALAMAWSFTAHHLGATLACLALWVASGLGLRMRSAAMQRAHYRLLRWFTGGIYRSLTRRARVEVHVHARDALAGHPRPLVVLSRHAGEGDSLLVLHELLCRLERRPRIVLHEALRLDPLTGALGQRLPNRFVDPRGGDTESEIAAMAADMGDGDAVLIFPEGANFSGARRRRGIRRLEEAGHDEEAAHARAMRHVTAPRPGGTLAALAAAPHADVVFVGHVGVPIGVRDLWRTIGRGECIELRLWFVSRDEVPSGHDERIDWLFRWWRTLDAWIGEHEGRAGGARSACGASAAPRAGR